MLVAGVGAAYVYRDALLGPSRPAAAAVRTATVRTGTLEQTIRLTGQTAGDGAVIRAPYLRGSRSRGRGAADFRLILEELAAPGKRVRRGETVAAFDRLYMLMRVDDIRSQRVELEAGVEKLRASLLLKREALDQSILAAKAARDKAALDLKTAPVRSAIQVELFKLALEEAEAVYQARLKDVKQQEIANAAELRVAGLDVQDEIIDEGQARTAADRMIVRAPMDGFAVVRDIRRAGELAQISAGDELHPGQPFLQIVDPDTIVVEAAVNQVDVARLREGAPAQLTFDAYPDLTLSGKVHSISPVVQTTGRRQGFKGEAAVVIKFERSDDRIIPSMSVGADVLIGEEQNAEIVPREAIFHDDGDGQPYVYVRTASGWEKRDIELGLQNNVAAAVRSGLAPGEVVAAGDPPAVNLNTD